MEEIVESFIKFKMTKEIRQLLNHISSSYSKEMNLSQVFLELLQEDLIGSSELIAIRSTMMMNRYMALVRQEFPAFMHSIYLYEHERQRLWNSSVADVPMVYNEYTHGLCVKNDVLNGSRIPLYIGDVLVVDHVERSEHYICDNHRAQLLKAGIQAFCSIPLMHNGHSFGHKVMYARDKRVFSEQEVTRYRACAHLIEKELVSMKHALLEQIRPGKIS